MENLFPRSPGGALPVQANPPNINAFEKLSSIIELINHPVLQTIINLLPEITKIVNENDSWTNKIFKIIGLLSSSLNTPN